MDSGHSISLVVEEFRREQEMLQAGRSTLVMEALGQQQSRKLAPRARRALLTEAFQGILKNGKTELVSAIADQLNARKRGRPGVLQRELAALDAEPIAYCALRVLLNEELGEISQQSAAIKIGEALAFEARLARVRSGSPDLWRRIEDIARKVRRPAKRPGLGKQRATTSRKTKRPSAAVAALHDVKRLLRLEEEQCPATRETLFQLGNKLLQLLLAFTDLFEVRHAHKRPNIVQLSPEAQARTAIRQRQLLKYAPPQYQPMVHQPERWRSVDVGGYVSIPLSAIKPRGVTKYSRLYRSELETADLTRVLEPLNLLQETGWRVNAEVLKVMCAKEVQSLLQGVYNRRGDARLQFDEGLDQGSKEARDSAMQWMADKIISEVTDRSEEDDDEQGYRVFKRTAHLGEAYRSASQPFYFVWQLDFRGRAYPVGKLLQPQGQDAARALLRFDEVRPLGKDGELWLAIHGANVLGIDGQKRDERVEGVYRREAEILAIAADPIGTTGLWLLDNKGARKPKKKAWRSLAFCLEWARMKRQGARFVSYLPVSMDGTCNAIQHFAAMLRDPVLGRLTNLSPAAAASDAYLDVARRTCDAIRRSPSSTEKYFLEGLALPLDRLIDRDLCKQPVMTKSYGITKFGLTRQVREALKNRHEYMAGLEQQVKDIGDRQQRGTRLSALHAAVSRYVADHIYAEVKGTLARADDLMRWMQVCAQRVVENGKPVRWMAPNGFPVMQAYQRNKSTVIKTELSGVPQFKASALTLKLPIDELAMHKAVNGIAANFVHSHDAAHMMLTTLAARREGITALRMIHDSFATHAGAAATLARVLREEFVRMYQRHDVLADFHRCCAEQLDAVTGRSLPMPPARGALDLACVLESDYFFA